MIASLVEVRQHVRDNGDASPQFGEPMFRPTPAIFSLLALLVVSIPRGPAAATTRSATQEVPTSAVRAVALRLLPGDDLRQGLLRHVRSGQWSAVSVLTCVGSLKQATIRFANQNETWCTTGPLEIVSLVGTAGPDGAHLHIAVSDAEGHTVGGHLMDGSPIHTTAEIVLAVLPDLRFQRVTDPHTGFRELLISPVGTSEPASRVPAR
ncbi:MAG: PPC domain-containing DNA-binding protein [Candidatus Sericytochromatia bacterium]|nr:PPC domain-containing DNA-binding protein [Candidatus Sericytochromatia bacterium]